MQHQIINNKHVKNLNDFKLLKAGWVFDFNFLPTFRFLQERNYLKRIQQVLPDTQEIRDIFLEIQHYLDMRLKQRKKGSFTFIEEPFDLRG